MSLKKMPVICLLSLLLVSCSNNKNLAQSSPKTVTDTMIKLINKSKKDTAVINPHLKTLQQQNDLVIAFAVLNYAWARTGTYYVLAGKNQDWKLYSYKSKLYPAVNDTATEITSVNIEILAAQKIKQLYESSHLWETEGDEDGNFCSGKKKCNINDAETWTISIATPQNIHTTTFYAPQFFEECCPGNMYRKNFITIANEMMKLGKNQISSPDK